MKRGLTPEELHSLRTWANSSEKRPEPKANHAQEGGQDDQNSGHNSQRISRRS